jgi:hypothetical protein
MPVAQLVPADALLPGRRKARDAAAAVALLHIRPFKPAGVLMESKTRKVRSGVHLASKSSGLKSFVFIQGCL